jgi:subtilisin family serine protease
MSRVRGGWTFNASFPSSTDCTGHETGNFRRPAVASMSWSVPNWVDNILVGSLQDAVVRAVRQGIPFVVSAGNNNYDACRDTPGRVDETITVGAVNFARQRWVQSSSEGSNWGNCVDLYAPGVNVPAANWTDNADRLFSGTSAATPFVAGTVAQLFERHGHMHWQTTKEIIRGSATPNWLQEATANNRFLYSKASYARISGLSAVHQTGYYEWMATGFGGGRMPYQYQWHQRAPVGSGAWTLVGTGPAYGRTVVLDDDTDFELRVTVTPGAETASNAIRVRVVTSGPCRVDCD